MKIKTRKIENCLKETDAFSKGRQCEENVEN